MKKIKLTQGKYAIVDNEDFDWLDQYLWQVGKSKKVYYARGDVNGKQTLMHRLILNVPKGLVSDHVNGNGLDNRRSNLRIVDYKQSNQNRKTPKNNTSGCRGVYKKGSKWIAQIGVSNNFNRSRMTYLGIFDNKVDAAKAYNKESIKLFGEFARLSPIRPIK